jgi:hypothetical protein
VSVPLSSCRFVLQLSSVVLHVGTFVLRSNHLEGDRRVVASFLTCPQLYCITVGRLAFALKPFRADLSIQVVNPSSRYIQISPPVAALQLCRRSARSLAASTFLFSFLAIPSSVITPGQGTCASASPGVFDSTTPPHPLSAKLLALPQVRTTDSAPRSLTTPLALHRTAPLFYDAFGSSDTPDETSQALTL